MIDKHNFWSIVSSVFTCLLIGKIIFEGIIGHRDTYYVENILTMFLVTVVGTFIISMHKYLQNVSILLVMFLQYVVLIGSVMGGLWIAGYFMDVDVSGYGDMFRSVTIPYVVLAGVYYISFFREVKKANALLAEINQEE